MQPIHDYRITFVNPAFSPKASKHVVSGTSPADACKCFRQRTNPAAIDRTLGDDGIINVEKLSDKPISY